MKSSLQIILFIAFSSIFSFQTKAQGYMLNSLIDTFSVANICDSTLSIEIFPEVIGNTTADLTLLALGTNYQASQFFATVNWGDGSSDVYTGFSTTVGSAIQFNFPMEHLYTTYGNHIVVVELTCVSGNNQIVSYMSPNIQVGCDASMYSAFSLDCDNDGTADSTFSGGVPLILSGSNGFTYFITTNASITHLTNLPVDNYTVTIDPAWLAMNGYIATGPVAAFYSGSMAPFTYFMSLICDTSNTVNACTFGYLFCDTDSNSIYSPGDIPISNAPVTMSFNNVTQSTITASSGYFNFNYSAAASTPIILTVDPAWLAQHGISVNNPITILPVDCAQSDTVYFAATCGALSIDSVCVNGTVFCDANSNGIFEAGESPLANAPVMISGSMGTITVYSDVNGNYSYYSSSTFAGSVATVQINPNWLAQHGYSLSNNMFTVVTDCASSVPLKLPVNCGSTQTPCADLFATVTPWIGYYQNYTNTIKLSWGNNGPSPTGSYQLSLTFPAGVTPVTSSFLNSAYVISGNTITWTLNNGSSNFQFLDYIQFSLPTGIPSGTVHNYTVTITPNGNVQDCDSTNNSGNLCMIVGNSYDPNDKISDQPATIDPSTDEMFTYVIRFQNTGTAPAQDIFIIDTISSHLKFDELQLLESSHYMQLIDLGNNIVKFNFPGIWLPDSTTDAVASQGYLVYRIPENAGNAIGSEITNTAHIYFDQNPAIVTNTTLSKNEVLGLYELQTSDIRLYPNPVTDVVQIVSSEMMSEINILDAGGKLVLQLSSNALSSKIDLTDFESGMYFVEIQTAAGSELKKLIKN